jgi:hypothetical protein
MNKLTQQRTATAARPIDWRKSISDHVAYALLAYTTLQIFVTVKALSEGVSGLLPYFALIVLVAGIIPLWRRFERRWSGLSDQEAGNPDHAPAFRRDVITLWALAIGLPLALTLLFKAIVALL